MGITARLVTHFGPLRVLVPSMLCVLVALATMSQVGDHQAYFPLLLLAFLLIGFGMGTGTVPLLTIAMAEVPAADAGLASGIINVSMQVAGALGVAVLGTISTDRTRSLLAHGHPAAGALTAGYHEAFLVAAGCVAVGLVFALMALRPRRRTADAPAAVPSRLEPSGERL
jgi:MFS family permease